MYTLYTEKLRYIVPFMGNLKCRKAYRYDTFTLQKVKKKKKTTKKLQTQPVLLLSLKFFLQWDAPLLCNNTCALLKDEEKVEETDLQDFVFYLLENGSSVAKIQVAHKLGQVNCPTCKTNQICVGDYTGTRQGGLKLYPRKENALSIQ